MKWKTTRQVLIFGLLVALAIAGGLIWPRDSWRRVDDLDQGVDAAGRPWIGATHPEIVIHEFFDYDCPHCVWAHKKLRSALIKSKKAWRIVRYDYARMSCAPEDERMRPFRCGAARAAHCTGNQGRYWEWNDAVVADPGRLSGTDRAQLELDLAAEIGLDLSRFKACLLADATIDFVQAVYMETWKKGIRNAPTYLIDNEFITLTALIKRLRGTGN
ncbi:MAG: thioredoxin domain-containing protein [Myxococcota bacterium]|nr:thioredoxin domain-containing protein [Myxococcota bacterium]